MKRNGRSAIKRTGKDGCELGFELWVSGCAAAESERNGVVQTANV